MSTPDFTPDSTPVNLRGFWVHHGQQLKWEKYIDKDGRPGYQAHQAMAAIEACGRDRRSVAIDGGAHVGMLTFHFARYFDRVHAFEPAPECFKCLALNFQNKPNVTLYNAALSNEYGTVNMAPRKMGWEVVPATNLIATHIPCIPIDSLNFAALDLLKLDVEGHEFEALEGAQFTIKEYKPIVIFEYKEELNNNKPIFKFMDDLGIKLLRTYKHDHLFIWP